MTQTNLHRLEEVRRNEGLSRQAVARNLGISVEEVATLEKPSSNMTLADLYRWQKVLNVPIAELLIDESDALAPVPNVQLRALLLKAMKTVRSIEEKTQEKIQHPTSIKILIKVLTEQLQEIMPELQGIAPWQLGRGHNRKEDELGKAFFRGMDISLDTFAETMFSSVDEGLCLPSLSG